MASCRRHGTTERRRNPQASSLRATFVGLLVLLFSWQSYTTQTHIHRQAGATAATSDVGAVSAGQKTQPGKTPAKPDSSNCPICQQLLHSGGLVAPGTLAVALPALATSIIVVPLEAAIIRTTLSHSWRGRAPPHI